MARFAYLFASLLIICGATACNNSEQRISRLEKDNQELRASIAEDQTVADYDLQAKCSRDARAWFNETWSRDKDTILLDFTNHYNKKLNKCFIVVEYHYNSHFAGPNGNSWTNDIEVSDVYENEKYGTFGENTYTYWKPTIHTGSEVVTCELYGQKCKTIQEFNQLLEPYISN